jgi:hypothetical protein
MEAAMAADSPFVGTWKLNSVKSKLEGSGHEGANGTVRLEQDGAGLKASLKIITAQGQSIVYSYQLTLDGKPVKVTGTAEFDEVETTRVNDRTFNAIGKKDGKLVFTDHRALSSDGKTITVTRKGTNPQGQAHMSTFVFDRQ